MKSIQALWQSSKNAKTQPLMKMIVFLSEVQAIHQSLFAIIQASQKSSTSLLVLYTQGLHPKQTSKVCLYLGRLLSLWDPSLSNVVARLKRVTRSLNRSLRDKERSKTEALTILHSLCSLKPPPPTTSAYSPLNVELSKECALLSLATLSSKEV